MRRASIEAPNHDLNVFFMSKKNCVVFIYLSSNNQEIFLVERIKNKEKEYLHSRFLESRHYFEKQVTVTVNRTANECLTRNSY